MRGRDAETIARFLPPVATNLLLKFDEREPWAYDTMPMPGRLELFQEGLLIGRVDSRKRNGAGLTQLGVETQRMVRAKCDKR